MANTKQKKGAESGKKQAGQKAKQKSLETAYRDERGVRKQVYRRFKEEVDYLPIEQNEMITILEFAKAATKRMGRPPIFESVEELQEAIEGYWDYLIKANNNGNALIPDVEGLAAFLHIDRSTLFDWERTNYNGFSTTIKETKNYIAMSKKQLALHGKIPPIVFATDFNNNHGYTQKQQLEISTPSPMGDMISKEELEAKVASDVIID